MFSTGFPPVVGGTERQAALLASYLVRRGIRVEVVTLRLDRSWPQREVLPPGVVIHRIPYLSGIRNRRRGRFWSLMVHLLVIPPLVGTIQRLSRASDILHAHNASSPITAFAIRVARRQGLKAVVKAVNFGPWFDLAQLRAYGPRGRIALRWMRRDVDRWLAISSAVKENLLAWRIPAERIIRMDNGVLVPDASRKIPDFAFRFLHLGRLDSKAPRDIEGLVEAFESVARHVPETQLALVGGGDRLEEVRRLCGSSPVASRIQVPGFQDGQRWRRWAHAYVQPSYFEGMSNSLLEAMAAGLPCLAYDVPPNREALDDGGSGILIPPEDHARLAAEMTRLATTAGLARELSRRARERASSTYEISAVAARAEQMYRQLLNAEESSAGEVAE